MAAGFKRDFFVVCHMRVFSFRLEFLAHNFPRYFGCWHELFLLLSSCPYYSPNLEHNPGWSRNTCPTPSSLSRDSGWLRLQKNLSLTARMMLFIPQQKNFNTTYWTNHQINQKFWWEKTLILVKIQANTAIKSIFYWSKMSIIQLRFNKNWLFQNYI